MKTLVMGLGVFFYVNAYQYAVVPNLQRKKNTTTSRRLENMFHHRVLWNYVMLAITRDRAFLKPGGCYRSMDGISAETNCSVNNTAMKEEGRELFVHLTLCSVSIVKWQVWNSKIVKQRRLGVLTNLSFALWYVCQNPWLCNVAI